MNLCISQILLERDEPLAGNILLAKQAEGLGVEMEVKMDEVEVEKMDEVEVEKMDEVEVKLEAQVKMDGSREDGRSGSREDGRSGSEAGSPDGSSREDGRSGSGSEAGSQDGSEAGSGSEAGVSSAYHIFGFPRTSLFFTWNGSSTDNIVQAKMDLADLEAEKKLGGSARLKEAIGKLLAELRSGEKESSPKSAMREIRRARDEVKVELDELNEEDAFAENFRLMRFAEQKLKKLAMLLDRKAIKEAMAKLGPGEDLDLLAIMINRDAEEGKGFAELAAEMIQENKENEDVEAEIRRLRRHDQEAADRLEDQLEREMRERVMQRRGAQAARLMDLALLRDEMKQAALEIEAAEAKERRAERALEEARMMRERAMDREKMGIERAIERKEELAERELEEAAEMRERAEREMIAGRRDC